MGSLVAVLLRPIAAYFTPHTHIPPTVAVDYQQRPTNSRRTFEAAVVDAYAQKRGLAEKPYVFVGSSLGADAFGIHEWRL
jgi:hypothetical protein